MRKGRFSEEQIIAILREQEAGMGAGGVCGRHEISSSKSYEWKLKYFCWGSEGFKVNHKKLFRNHWEE